MKPGKHNMKRLFAVVCVLGLLQSPATAMAQAGLAMKAGVVGVKVLIGLVGVQGRELQHVHGLRWYGSLQKYSSLF